MLGSMMLVCLMCVLFVNLISFLKSHYCTVQVDLSLVVFIEVYNCSVLFSCCSYHLWYPYLCYCP